MRLRTSRTKKEEEEATPSPEPSTSRYVDSPRSSLSPKHSPASPIGRVAKRNARLLNGLDLGGAQHVADSLVGTIPDFSIRRLQDFCPAVAHFLDEEEEHDDALLTDLQFQLEHLLAENLDWQKNIYGEMTFLSTGDYPTDDLHSRPMPSYELRSDSNVAHHQVDPDEPQPSISYVDHQFKEEDEAGSDVISSMDERELDEPYCVLDIPHRFWTWAREYIGHVDEKFLRDFNENFYARYQAEQMEEFFLNEPFKYKPSKQTAKESAKDSLSPAHKPPLHLNGVHLSGRKVSKSSGQLNGHIGQVGHVVEETPPKKRLSGQATRENLIKSLRTNEDNASDLMKRLVSAYIEEQAATSNEPKKVKPGRKPYAHKSPNKSPSKRSKQKKAKKRVNGELNGHSNGLESTDDETTDFLSNSDLMETFGQALAECVLPVGQANGHEADGESESEESEQEETDQQDEPSTNMENFELVKLKLDNKHSVEDLDEVSTELLKAQQRLEQLTKKVAPTLKKCKEGLEAEHAHWITTRALNSIDDELFRLANQIPMGATQLPDDLYKQCLEVWTERKRLLLAHYIRDHVKFVQYAEKSAADVQKLQTLMGSPEVAGKRQRPAERTIKRVGRKRASAVKKETAVEE